MKSRRSERYSVYARVRTEGSLVQAKGSASDRQGAGYLPAAVNVTAGFVMQATIEGKLWNL